MSEDEERQNAPRRAAVEMSSDREQQCALRPAGQTSMLVGERQSASGRVLQDVPGLKTSRCFGERQSAPRQAPVEMSSVGVRQAAIEMSLVGDVCSVPMVHEFRWRFRMASGWCGRRGQQGYSIFVAAWELMRRPAA